jgi:hypothetical protein
VTSAFAGWVAIDPPAKYPNGRQQGQAGEDADAAEV